MSHEEDIHTSQSGRTVSDWLSELNDGNVASSWLTAIIESADDAIISKRLDGVITSWNSGAERIFGYTAREAIGKHISILIPEDHRGEEAVIINRIRGGERMDHFETIRRTKDGKLINVSLTVSPVKGPDGNIVGASKIARDITESKLAKAALEEQKEIVQTIQTLGQLLSAELDLQKLVQAVTDAATELTEAEFGSFFYNVLNDEGGSYMLYTLSGVPKEAFANFPMPRATELFGPTFRGEGTIRLDNVKQDSRYGKSAPHHGMPAGHLPVTSYLAVPVTSRSGEVIGGLFFGHSEAGKFSERHEKIVEGIAAQAAVAMDNARLYKGAQQAVRDREQLLAREQEARRQAEVANRTKDEFLSLLSHELRTPLNAILGWTRMLTSGSLDTETFSRAVEIIDRNAKLQSRLIEDMLDVSRIISGKLRLDAQPTDLAGVINAAVDALRPAAEAKDIRVYVVLDFGAGAVLGDPVRLQQVVWNLLSNAIKFTPRGGSVRVSLERINSHLEITITDTGTGIEESFLPHVFDRFRQADSTSSKKYGGLGLGLSIVRHLVELHGGTVQAANRPDQTGAIFTVMLPLMALRKQESVAMQIERVHPLVSGAVPFDCPPELAGVKVLAVEDEPDARELISTVLVQCGAEVRTCESAAQALDLIREFQPDILVSDIGLPDEDGYSLIRKVRAAEEGTGRRLPAVALTAFARVEDRMKAMTEGYNMHVAKPVEPAELALVIASLTNQGKA